MIKPKIFKGECFNIKIHQITKHEKDANFTISATDQEISASTYWIDDMIDILQKAKKELEEKHEFKIIQGEKFYSMKEKTREHEHDQRGWQPK